MTVTHAHERRPGGRSPGTPDPYSVDPLEAALTPPPKPRPTGHTFGAELDVTELDERGRPGSVWAARARELSRSSLVLMSRRMMHRGRTLLVAVHLIDDRPIPLYGRVSECEYEADGLHRIVLDFLPLPESDVIREWVSSRGGAKPGRRLGA